MYDNDFRNISLLIAILRFKGWEPDFAVRNSFLCWSPNLVKLNSGGNFRKLSDSKVMFVVEFGFSKVEGATQCRTQKSTLRTQ